MRETAQRRFQVVISSKGWGKRVLVIDAPAALSAALIAFSEVSSEAPAVLDVSSMREVGRTTVFVEAASGRHYRVSVEGIDA